MSSLSRGFVLLLPLLFIDALLDIAFLRRAKTSGSSLLYGRLLEVPSPGLFNVGCPFCFITYQYPLLWGVIAAYAVSAALVIWSFLFSEVIQIKWLVFKKKFLHYCRKVMRSLYYFLAIVGTVLLLLQIGLGIF